MIHHQQIATPVPDIVAGLCFAVARNLKSNLAKGRDLPRPVVFQGGVAANAGVVRAFREILGLHDGELIIPEYHASMGAIGAVYHLLFQAPRSRRPPSGLAGLRRHLGAKVTSRTRSLCAPTAGGCRPRMSALHQDRRSFLGWTWGRSARTSS